MSLLSTISQLTSGQYIELVQALDGRESYLQGKIAEQQASSATATDNVDVLDSQYFTDCLRHLIQLRKTLEA